MHTLEELYQELLNTRQVAQDCAERLVVLEQRVARAGLADIPEDLAYIPAGSFVMGATTNAGHESYADELPQHTVHVSAFCLDRREVTKTQWDAVAGWATNNGYAFSAGCGLGKAGDHPVHTVSWHDCVKWCNARSELAGLAACYTVSGEVYRAGEQVPDCDSRAGGYRLPTEAEWEKAARGGAANRRFPWGDTSEIRHARANYVSHAAYPYDTSPTRGYHPDFGGGAIPYTSPAGSFAPNGYGLYDMAGNVWEWCWDWYAADYYASSLAADPAGAASGSSRVFRSGSWAFLARDCRSARRDCFLPYYRDRDIGFRAARTLP
jgi:formylglycine-generating enzyme required for sulfatase activity